MPEPVQTHRWWGDKKYKVFTAQEEIYAEFPDDAFDKFTRKGELLVIVEEETPLEPLKMRIHEYHWVLTENNGGGKEENVPGTT